MKVEGSRNLDKLKFDVKDLYSDKLTRGQINRAFKQAVLSVKGKSNEFEIVSPKLELTQYNKYEIYSKVVKHLEKDKFIFNFTIGELT